MQTLKSVRYPKTSVGYKSFDKIIHCAKILFSNKGFSSTSVNEIISESRVAAGTFYKYFDDKRAVYYYLLKDYSNQIKSEIRNAISKEDTRFEQEKKGIKAFLKFALRDRLSYGIIWESLFVDVNLFVDYYKSFSESYVRQLHQSTKSGELNPNIDLETLSFILMGISNFVGLQLLFEETPTDEKIDSVVDTVMYVLKNGIFTK